MDNLTIRIASLKGIQKDRMNSLSEIKSKLATLSKEQNQFEKAVTVVLAANRYLQERLEYCLSSIVTSALQSVFEEPYEFKFIFTTRADKTLEARPVLLRNGEEYDPLSATGGGVVDIVSFALRLSCLLISYPTLERIIIADEPFVHVSIDLQSKVREMLEEISEKLGMQFLIVSHEEELT